MIVCSPPPFLQGVVEPPTKFLKMGDLTGPHLLEGVAGKEGDGFFQGGLEFLHKK